MGGGPDEFDVYADRIRQIFFTQDVRFADGVECYANLAKTKWHAVSTDTNKRGMATYFGGLIRALLEQPAMRTAKPTPEPPATRSNTAGELLYGGKSAAELRRMVEMGELRCVVEGMPPRRRFFFTSTFLTLPEGRPFVSGAPKPHFQGMQVLLLRPICGHSRSRS